MACGAAAGAGDGVGAPNVSEVTLTVGRAGPGAVAAAILTGGA